MKTKKLTTEEFNALPRQEKAVLVAKDVLAQLKARKINPVQGNYITIYGDYELTEDVKSNTEKIKYCSACALGSCILGVTRLGNQLNFKELGNFVDSNKAIKLLRSVFTGEQLMLIEFAFEGWSETKHDGVAKCQLNIKRIPKDLDKCQNFYFKHGNPEQRLTAIMKNIVKNSGVFIP